MRSASSSRTGVRARFLVALLAIVGVTLSACAAGSDVSSVTVSAGGKSVELPSAIACISPEGATELSCAGGDNDDTAPHLAVAPDTPLTISVPTAVGDTPWVVVFSYTDSNGDPQGDRTPVFSPKQQYSYELSPPTGAQLHRLEVQSLTVAPGADGGIEFPAVGTWVLLIDPAGRKGTPTNSSPGGATVSSTAAADGSRGTASDTSGGSS